MDTITTTEYGSFQAAFDWFNTHLFEGCKLPNILITLNRHPKSKGYFSPDRFTGRTDTDAKVSELALNPDVFPGRSDEDILSMLAHEMTHLWQATHGRSPRSGYHDKQWSAKMKSIGLIPSHTGQVGGKKTGQKMTHYVQADGPYQVAYKDLQSTGFALKWQSPEEVKVKGKPKKQSSKTKFTCPKCQQNVWGCPEVRVACGVCYAASGDDASVVFLIRQGGWEPPPKAKAAGAGAFGGDDDEDEDGDSGQLPEGVGRSAVLWLGESSELLSLDEIDKIASSAELVTGSKVPVKWQNAGIGGPDIGSRTFKASEVPNQAVTSTIYDIVETNVDPNYDFSHKCCAGILNRWRKHCPNKPVPQLSDILVRQAGELVSDEVLEWLHKDREGTITVAGALRVKTSKLKGITYDDIPKGRSKRPTQHQSA